MRCRILLLSTPLASKEAMLARYGSVDTVLIKMHTPVSNAYPQPTVAFFFTRSNDALDSLVSLQTVCFWSEGNTTGRAEWIRSEKRLKTRLADDVVVAARSDDSIWKFKADWALELFDCVVTVRHIVVEYEQGSKLKGGIRTDAGVVDT